MYASGGNADRVFRYTASGADRTSPRRPRSFPVTASWRDRRCAPLPAGDGIRVTSYPGPLARYGDYVLAAGTLSEQSAGACPTKRPVCGRVSVIDTRTDAVVGRAAVGQDPFGLAVDPVRKARTSPTGPMSRAGATGSAPSRSWTSRTRSRRGRRPT